MAHVEPPEGADRSDKAVWRTALRARRRRAIAGTDGEEHRTAEGAALQAALDAELAARGVPADAVVAAFAPTPTEPDLGRWLRAQASAGRPILLPAASGTEELDWVLWGGRSLLGASPARGFGDEPTDGERLGAAGISRAAVILAPALAVDRSGTRLGQGGGYYDRALTLRSPAAPVLVVVHPEEVLPAGSLPREEHDAPFDAAVTAHGTVTIDAVPECATSRRGPGAAS